jgi:hypothetical protein
MNDLERLGMAELARFLNDHMPRLSPLWWQTHVVQRLTRQQQRAVRERRRESLQELDLAALQQVFYQNWHELANALSLPLKGRTWVGELRDVRNRWAHLNADPMPASEVHRDADTLYRVLDMIGASRASLDAVELIRRAAVNEMARANGHSPGNARQPSNSVPTRAPGGSACPRHIEKWEAIDRVNTCCKPTILNNRNTRFANINLGVDVWWLHIPPGMVEPDGRAIHVLLYDHRCGAVHYLRVPGPYFTENLSNLVVRRANGTDGVISLSLSTDRPRLFQDVRRGVPFAQFLQPCKAAT